MELKDIKFSNKAVEFTRYNLKNGIHTQSAAISLLSPNVREKIQEGINKDNSRRKQVYFYLNAGVGLICYFFIYCANLKTEQAVTTFYGFSDEYLKRLTRKSEKFVEFIHNEQAKIEEDAVGHFEDFDMLGEETDSEISQSRMSQGHGSQIAEKRRFYKENKSDFLNLKKRKKKGTLAPLISLWQIYWLFLMAFGLLGHYSGIDKQIDIVSRGIKASTFIYELNALFGLPIVFKNYLVMSLINPRDFVRGVPPTVLAAVYIRIQNLYNKQLFKVKNTKIVFFF